VLERDGRNGVAHNNLANLLRLSRRFRDAEMHYRLALEQLPDSAEIRHSLADTLEELGQYDLAEVEYRRAIQLKPDFGAARFDLGLLLLAAGRYAEGWPYFEARAHVFREHGQLPFPKWNGEDLRGKTILLLPEQGYGDTIQFVRYVALLKDRSAVTVSVLCKPALAPVLRAVRNIDALITEPQSLRVHDYWTSLMSLPYHFGTTLESIPARVPYIGVFSNRLQTWKATLPGDGLRVGLAWKGNPEHDNDAQRSVHHFSDLLPLWSIKGVHFISLQVGDAEAEIDDCQESQPIVRLGREIRDFGDTAAIIAQLNLVICVDTAVAHLTGALGIACWVMLPYSGVDWRWHRSGTSSPWYPEGMFLFRQNERGWPGAIGDVKDALSDVIRQLNT
jgi:tetratricopeptide (TPR) repeat protein